MTSTEPPVDPQPAAKMKAMVQREYGPPEVLRLETIDKPVVPDDRVLVRICAASVNAGDWHLMRGTPFLIRLMFGGLRRPQIQILGSDMAGRVETVGSAVQQFQGGDAVFGDLSEYGFGAFAEYVCVPETALIHKPETITFEQAAAVPGAALAALQGLRDLGQIQSGQRVLIHGASGGVGSYAVQIAKAFGTEVTGVCGTAKVEMVRSLGADQVIDYSKTDPTQPRHHYDLILDAAAYRSISDWLPTLKPQGTYVLIGGSTLGFFQALLLGPLISKLSGRQVKCLTSNPNQADLKVLKDLMIAGQIRPFIDRIYSLEELPKAIQALEDRQVRGKVVIQI